VYEKLVSTEKCSIASFYTIADSLIARSDCSVGIWNKEQVGKHRIISYCEPFPY